MADYQLVRSYGVYVNGRDITGLLTGLIWEENAGEIAARAHITFAFDDTLPASLLDDLQLMNIVTIITDTLDVVFTGVVFDWDYTISDPTSVTIIAYSPAIYLTRSKENYLFNQGETFYTVHSALDKIMSDWAVPKGDWDFPDAPVAKPMYRREKIADIIFDLLQQVRFATNAEIVVRNNGLALDITKPGKNGTVYQFHADNVISLQGRWDMLDLVTQVKIYEGLPGAAPQGGLTTSTGLSPNAGRIIAGPYVAKYGVMQEVLEASGPASDDDEGDDETEDSTELQADEILALRGEPRHSNRIVMPDIPTVRKGDYHRFDIGPMQSSRSGPFTVSGVRHDATNGFMTIEVGTSDFKRRASTSRRPSVSIPEDPPGVGVGTPGGTQDVPGAGAPAEPPGAGGARPE
jgi:hypothetical protein